MSYDSLTGLAIVLGASLVVAWSTLAHVSRQNRYWRDQHASVYRTWAKEHQDAAENRGRVERLTNENGKLIALVELANSCRCNEQQQAIRDKLAEYKQKQGA